MASARPGIERIAQTVAQEGEAQHEDGDRAGREDDAPDIALDHPVAVGDEEVAKMGTEETCPSCDDGGRHLADATEAS